MNSLLFVLVLASGLEAIAAENTLTESEHAAGWKLLFDGHSTLGWRSFKKNDFPKAGWIVDEECLKHLSKGGGGDIITDRDFNDFDLQFEWRIEPGANSGLKYFVTESRRTALGHEYQLIDDALHPDSRRGAKWQTGAFYDVLPPSNRLIKPPGEFNRSRILVRGNHVEHWLNDQKILEYELGSPEVLAAVGQSKFKAVEGFGTKIRGHILLQDHGDAVAFRNIKILELSK